MVLKNLQPVYEKKQIAALRITIKLPAGFADYPAAMAWGKQHCCAL